MTAVCKRQCAHCLLGDKPLLDAAAIAKKLQEAARSNRHFVCHEATARGEDVMCRGWWDNETLRVSSNLGRVMERLAYDPDQSGWMPVGPATDREYAAMIDLAKRATS